MIVRIVWQSVGAVFGRVLNGVDPNVTELIHGAYHVEGIREVSDVHARWIGHQMRAELNIAVDSNLTVEVAHEIAQVRHQLMYHVQFLSSATIHVDPVNKAGDQFHTIESHTQDGLPAHSHT